MNDNWRPRRRSDCVGMPRPCPYVGCRYNLFLDVRVDGRLVLRHGDKDPLDVPPGESCALDVAGAGAHTATEVARLMHFTKARVSQIVEKASVRLRVLQEQDDIGPEDFGVTLAEYAAR